MSAASVNSTGGLAGRSASSKTASASGELVTTRTLPLVVNAPLPRVGAAPGLGSSGPARSAAARASLGTGTSPRVSRPVEEREPMSAVATAAVVRRLRRALAALGLVLLGGSTRVPAARVRAARRRLPDRHDGHHRRLPRGAPADATGKAFTIGVILVGVGTSLYTLGVLFEAMVEGHLTQHLEERRMAREITRMSGHVIVCGWGRVGHACAGRARLRRRRCRDRRPERRATGGDRTPGRAGRRLRRRRPGRGRHRPRPGARRGAGHRRRQRLRHALRPGAATRSRHHRPGPLRGLGRQVAPRRRGSRRQPAADRRSADGGLRLRALSSQPVSEQEAGERP